MAKAKVSAPSVVGTPLTGKNRPGKLPRMKKRLTSEEEFQILKLVLDKILWLGFGIMALGLYEMYRTINNPFALMFAGAAILILFVFLLMREYEVVRN